MRRLDDLLPENQRAGLGHNGGPPLDVSYKAWVWRKAHARAWASPGREIVMLRLRRAERLGLSYEAYTSVILDRGARLEGVIAAPSPSRLKSAAAKLATLSDCCVMLAFEKEAVIPDLLRKMAAHIAVIREEGLPPTIKSLVQMSRLPPSALFLVGPESYRSAAQRASLGLFLDEKIYFAGP